MEPTIEEREEVYKEEKTIDGRLIRWKFVNGSYKLSAKVLRPNGEYIDLEGVLGGRGNISFTLYYIKPYLIRRFDHKNHKNPTGEKFSGPHKHKWTEEYGDNEAYPVDDVPIHDINEALEGFLKECNIKIEGSYQKMLLL